MSIEALYQNFIESEHKDSQQTDIILNSAIEKRYTEMIADSIESELHSGFVSGFIAGVTFMKGALR